MYNYNYVWQDGKNVGNCHQVLLCYGTWQHHYITYFNFTI